MTDKRPNASLSQKDALALSRRTLVKGGSALMGTMILSTLANLSSRQAFAAQTDPVAGPFGPAVDTRDLNTGLPLLKLPRGFRYSTYSWTGDMMTDGQATPSAHDGMAVVASKGRELTLIRNHEKTDGALITGGGVYDHVALGSQSVAGGTTNLKFNGRTWQSARGSLGGTVRNCSGGGTPWGSWLTCEETTSDYRSFGGERHGYVFEVPAESPSTGEPLKDMGRFAHEAVAVDAVSNIAYLTEDRRNNSGFYRFLPTDASGTLDAYAAGGTLQMLSVVGEPGRNLINPTQGETFAVEWVDVADPDATSTQTFNQGFAEGGARFNRLEGAHFYDDAIYFTDTESGPANEGSVWVYRINPEDRDGSGELTALFVAQNTITGNNPDNLTVSPQGLVLFCEDGGGQALRVMGLTPEGESFVFGVNNVDLSNEDIASIGRTGQFSARDYTRSEWAGACFSPRGDVLFVNIQSPGITFAIWGPFGRARW